MSKTLSVSWYETTYHSGRIEVPDDFDETNEEAVLEQVSQIDYDTYDFTDGRDLSAVSVVNG